MTSQRIERFVGLLAGVAGLAGLAIVLFGPVIPYQIVHGSQIESSGATGLLLTPDGYLLWPPAPAYMIPIVLSVTLPVLVAISALLHSRQRRSAIWLFLLWGATVGLLLAIVFISLQLLQLVMLPSLLLALVACVLAYGASRQTRSAAVA